MFDLTNESTIMWRETEMSANEDLVMSVSKFVTVSIVFAWIAALASPNTDADREVPIVER